MTPESRPIVQKVLENEDLRMIHTLGLQKWVFDTSLDTWEKVTACVASFVGYAKGIVNGITSGQISQNDIWDDESRVDYISDLVWDETRRVLKYNTTEKLFEATPGEKKYNNWRLTKNTDGSHTIDLVEIKPGVVFTAFFDVPKEVPIENVASAFAKDNPLQDISQPGFAGWHNEQWAAFLFRRKLVVNDADGNAQTLFIHIGNHVNPADPNSTYWTGWAFQIHDQLIPASEYPEE